MSEEFTDVPIDHESMQRCFSACYNSFMSTGDVSVPSAKEKKIN